MLIAPSDLLKINKTLQWFDMFASRASLEGLGSLWELIWSALEPPAPSFGAHVPPLGASGSLFSASLAVFLEAVPEIVQYLKLSGNHIIFVNLQITLEGRVSPRAFQRCLSF